MAAEEVLGKHTGLLPHGNSLHGQHIGWVVIDQVPVTVRNAIAVPGALPGKHQTSPGRCEGGVIVTALDSPLHVVRAEAMTQQKNTGSQECTSSGASLLEWLGEG